MDELTTPPVFFTAVLPIGLILAAFLWAMWVIYLKPGAEQPYQRPHDPGTGDE